MLNKIFKNKDKLFILLIIIIGFILYANIFNNQFFWDDHHLITSNLYVKNFSIDKIFTTNVVAGAGRQSNFYRPMVLLSFALDYKLWGLNPIGFHLTNLLIHILSAILIYLIFSLLQPKKIVSFLTSFLFLIHPLQVESVTYISGRTELPVVLFCLFSLYLFIKIYRNPAKGRFYYAISLISFIFALLSKEIALVFPFLLPIVYFVFIKRKFTRANIKDITLKILPFLFIVVIYLILRFVIFEFQEAVGNSLIGLNIFSRFLVFSKVLLEYWKIILIPTNLHIRLVVTMPLTSWDPGVIFSLLILGVIVYFSVLSLRKKRFLFFGFSWFFIGLIPVSNVLIPINSLLGERWLRLPSIGLFFLAAVAIDNILLKLHQHKSFKKVFIFLLLIYFAALSIITIKTNALWKDAITHYTYLLKYYPDRALIRNNLGVAYNETGDYEQAEKIFKEAISLDSSFSLAHRNLAEIYKKTDREELAIESYRTVIEISPKNIASYTGLMDIYMENKEYQKARELAESYLDFSDSKDAKIDTLLLLAQIAFKQNDLEATFSYLDEAIAINIRHKGLQKFIINLNDLLKPTP